MIPKRPNQTLQSSEIRLRHLLHTQKAGKGTQCYTGRTIYTELPEKHEPQANLEHQISNTLKLFLCFPPGYDEPGVGVMGFRFFSQAWTSNDERL